MPKEVKKCAGKMCEKKCCANCSWWHGTRPPAEEDEYWYFNYKGWCALTKEDCDGSYYCGDDWRLDY